MSNKKENLHKKFEAWFHEEFGQYGVDPLSPEGRIAWQAFSSIEKATGMVLVDADNLRQILIALNGDSYLIRELQATRDKPPLITGNPIDALIIQYNEFSHKSQTPKI